MEADKSCVLVLPSYERRQGIDGFRNGLCSVKIDMLIK